MNTKKTVFLLGAGASANAMPINRNLQERIEKLANILERKMPTLLPIDSQQSGEDTKLLKLLVNDLRWLAKESREYDTVDEFARHLYENGSRDVLWRLKLALVTFFELEPMTRERSDDQERLNIIANRITDEVTLLNSGEEDYEAKKWVLIEAQRYIEQAIKNGKFHDRFYIYSIIPYLEPIVCDIKSPDLDPRYLLFYKTIASSRNSASQPSGEYKVLSWNYDTQLELGHARYLDYRWGQTGEYCFESSLHALQQICKHSTWISNQLNPNKLAVYKLNGIACMRKGDNLSAILNNFGEALTSDTIRLFLLGYKSARERKEDYTPAISYAWEEDTILENDVIQLATRDVKDAECLIIIGYSFPLDNRKTDEKIIREMNNLKTVYIQDKEGYTSRVKENFKEIRNDVHIIEKEILDSNEPFHVPFPEEYELTKEEKIWQYLLGAKKNQSLV